MESKRKEMDSLVFYTITPMDFLEWRMSLSLSTSNFFTLEILGELQITQNGQESSVMMMSLGMTRRT